MTNPIDPPDTILRTWAAPYQESHIDVYADFTALADQVELIRKERDVLRSTVDGQRHSIKALEAKLQRVLSTENVNKQAFDAVAMVVLDHVKKLHHADNEAAKAQAQAEAAD